MFKTLLQQQSRRILSYSTKSCLFRRSYKTLSAVKTDLEQWRKQGDQANPSYVRGLIKNFRDSNQFSKALEASEWMCEQRVFDIFPEDYAARLHLVETVLGLEEAEKFFQSIPENMRDYAVYDVLLRSYTRSEKTLDKAEAMFEKMRDLGFLLKPSPFNSMISLYHQLNKQDMVDKLQRELMETNVEMDSLTEKTNVEMDSLTEKTNVEMDSLKLQRELMETNVETESLTKNHVLSSDKCEEHCGSNEDKKKVKVLVTDDDYRNQISYLLKLDDVEGAEKIYKEWEPLGLRLDMSIPDLLISRFRAEGNESKVEEMVDSLGMKTIKMHFETFLFSLFVGVCIAGSVWLYTIHPMVLLASWFYILTGNPILAALVFIYIVNQ